MNLIKVEHKARESFSQIYYISSLQVQGGWKEIDTTGSV